MKPFILSISDPHADLETTGGKGMSLAHMLNAGLPVPGGFQVTTEAYRRFVSANNIQIRILEALDKANSADPASLEAVSQAIEQFFLEGQIPSEISEAIAAAYSPFKDTPVAVRSSATAEDLPDASFAGQQETFLNIRGVSALLEAVKKCWASLWTARAIAYRIKNNIDQEMVTLAVVVQELVFAEAAGILFTANPVNGKRDQVVINAAWGLGEAIVSGAVTPDTLTVSKATGKVLQRETAEKLVMTVRTETGVSEQAVPTSLQKKAVLSNRQAAELAAWGVKIEAFYGTPMDIEWAYADGKFYILQARPITALPPDWTPPQAGAIYARGSLAEHLPAPVTPLFASLGLKIANQVTARLWENIFGRNTQALLTDKGFYLPINGYVYGGIRMDFKGTLTVTWGSITQTGPMLRGSVARWQNARAEFATVVKEWEQKNIRTFTPSELLGGACAIFEASCNYFTRLQTALPAASSSETLFVKFYDGLVKRKGSPAASVFLLGFETAALRAEKSLFDLATWLKDIPPLANYLLNSPTDRLQTELNSHAAPASLSTELWDEWRARFQRHLDEYCHTTFEFDFSNPTPAETPGPLFEAIKAFLNGQAGNPYERQKAAIARREQATQDVLGRLGWPLKSWFIRLLHWAQETGPMREDGIADMGMGHPVIRRMFGELGDRFVAAGAINDANDIYWLEETEVRALIAALEEGTQPPQFGHLISPRKADWQAFLKVSPPVMLPEKSGWSRVIHGGEAERKNGAIMLKGVGTSSGVITAPACVVYSPEDFGKMKPGDVLVAVTTTPAWTPLFTLASAVVTDIGGPLSHSSIVAREYGIPAVMAARSASRLIHDGQIVTVDGWAGTVMLRETPG